MRPLILAIVAAALAPSASYAEDCRDLRIQLEARTAEMIVVMRELGVDPDATEFGSLAWTRPVAEDGRFNDLHAAWLDAYAAYNQACRLGRDASGAWRHKSE